MVQKGGQTANSGGLLSGIQKAFNAAVKVINPEEQPTTYQPMSTTTRPPLAAAPLANTASTSMTSLKPSMTGGKRKRGTRKNKKRKAYRTLRR